MESHLEELQVKIGKELKRLRIEAGFSSYEVFADKTQLSRIQYFKMEKGTNCTLKSLDRVLKLHNISIINFFHGFKKETDSIKSSQNKERINKILELLKISKNELSQKIGLSNSNQINAILNGRNNISLELAYKINKVFPEINVMWIFNGQGKMI